MSWRLDLVVAAVCACTVLFPTACTALLPNATTPTTTHPACPSSDQFISVEDEDRQKRLIKARVCMPAMGSSASRPGLVVFTAGGGLTHGDYDWVCEELPRFGFAVALQVPPPELLALAAAPLPPANETQPYTLPNTCEDWDVDEEDRQGRTVAQDTALDQLYIAEHLLSANSSFNGCLSGRVVLGGHSFGGGVSLLAAGMLLAASSAWIDVVGLLLLSPGTYTDPPVLPTLECLEDVSGSLPPIASFVGDYDTDLNSFCSTRLLAAVNSTNTCMKVTTGARLGHCEWADEGCRGGRFPGTPTPKPDDELLSLFRASALPLIAHSLANFFDESKGTEGNAVCSSAAPVTADDTPYTWTSEFSRSCGCDANMTGFHDDMMLSGAREFNSHEAMVFLVTVASLCSCGLLLRRD